MKDNRFGRFGSRPTQSLGSFCFGRGRNDESSNCLLPFDKKSVATTVRP
jgi:hypothetical protein